MWNVINPKVSHTVSDFFTSCETTTSPELIQISGVHYSPRMNTEPISFKGFTFYSSVNTLKSNHGWPRTQQQTNSCSETERPFWNWERACCQRQLVAVHLAAQYNGILCSVRLFLSFINRSTAVLPVFSLLHRERKGNVTGNSQLTPVQDTVHTGGHCNLYTATARPVWLLVTDSINPLHPSAYFVC